MKTNLFYVLITLTVFGFNLKLNAQSGWREIYSSSLTTPEEFAQWEVINYGWGWGSPDDEFMFKFTNGLPSNIDNSLNSGPCAYYSQSDYANAFDLLVSPEITLEANKKYKITFEAFTTGSSMGKSMTHTIEILLGTDRADKLAQYNSMKSDIGWSINPTTNQIKPTASRGNIDGFTVPETKAYKISFYNSSGANDRGSICFRNFKVYVESQCLVTINTPENGTLKVFNGGTELNSGDEVSPNTALLVLAIPEIGYTTGQITANGTPIESSVTVTGDITIDATFVKTTHTVSWTNPQGGTINVQNQGINVNNGESVDSGSTLTINVELESGYKLTGLKVNDTPLEGNEFEITEDLIIKAEVEQITHLVRLPTEIEGVSVTTTEGHYDSIEDAYWVIENQPFTFTVKLDEEYTQSDYTVYSNGTKLDRFEGTSSNAIYKLTSVTEEINITIEGITLNKYYIKLPNIEGITITVTDGNYNSALAAYEVNYNANFEFEIQLEQSHNLSEYTVISDPSTTINNLGNGKFSINNITQDITINIEGVEINTYQIEIPEITGATITVLDDNSNTKNEPYSINYGEDFKFEVTLSDSHNLSNYTVTSEPEGLINNLDNGKYVITNVTQNIKISIQGVELNKYQIEIPEVTGVTVTILDKQSTSSLKTSQTVNHGDNFKFSVLLNQGYENSSYTVTSEPEGLVKTLSSGQFTIENIEGDIKILINNVTPNNYTVKLPSNITGATVKAINADYDSENQSYNVTYGNDFKFSVVLDKAYNNSNYIVKANGTPITHTSGTLANATYQLTAVKENIEITIESIIKNKYTITVIQTANGTISPETSIVEHGEEITFEIVPDENYGILEALVDDVIVTLEATKKSYTFKNVEAPHKITATFKFLDKVTNLDNLSLNIYPNPVKDIINITGEYQKIEIYNISGELLITANGESQIDVSNLKNGTYIIKAYKENNFATYKIIK